MIQTIKSISIFVLGATLLTMSLASAEEVIDPTVKSGFSCLIAGGKWRAGKCFVDAGSVTPPAPETSPGDPFGTPDRAKDQPETPEPDQGEPTPVEDMPDSPFRDVVMGSEVIHSQDGLVVFKTRTHYVFIIER